MRLAARYAFSDISAYLNTDRNNVVGRTHLDTKETKLLNWRLGINRVNYLGNTNNIY